MTCHILVHCRKVSPAQQYVALINDLFLVLLGEILGLIERGN